MEKKSNYKLPRKFNFFRKVFPKIERFAPGVADKIAVYLFFRPLNFNATAEEEQAFQTSQVLPLEIAGKKSITYSWGEGKPVLMTHGWAGRGTQFRKFVAPFNENGYKVVSFDAPAHGRSFGQKTHMGEFKELIMKLEEIHGSFEATIGHSFGGAVNMYATLKGLSPKKMILISSPSVPEDILENFLSIINGHKDRLVYFKKYVREQFGVEFNEMSTYVMSESLEPLPMLIIHDLNDKDVPISHAISLQSKLSYPRFYQTEGLGHNRILKNSSVINACIDFIQEN